MFSYKDKSILVVDDQKAFHDMLKTMFAHQGVKNIKFSDNVEGAIKLARHKKFDIYLIDYNLDSNKNGLQLFDYLKKNKFIPNFALCFIISGYNEKGRVLTAIEKAPDDYLMKPFSQTQLFDRLRNAYRKKKVLSYILNALRKKNYTLAIKLCKEKIKTEIRYKGLCENLLADIFIQSGQFDKAESLLKAQLEQRSSIRASITLSQAYYFQHKYSEMISLLKEVITYSPLQTEAHQWLAHAYQKNGDFKNALSTLTHVANMTHHSIDRHQEVALLAREMNEYEIMVSSYSQILNLSRHSFYPDPCHLANYVRSIMDLALQQNDQTERKKTLQKVNSALYQSRFQEGKNKNFDFNSFGHICQSKVLLTLDQPLKAKQAVLNTLHKIKKPIAKFDDTLLYESLFSLLDIGEFDSAEPYIQELKRRDIIDPTTQAAIDKKTGIALKSRMHTFKSHNKMGINAFSKKDYNNALIHFNEALKHEPLNSGALLNRIQVCIQLLKPTEDGELFARIKHCQNDFDLLTNIKLPEEHNRRYIELKNELEACRKVK